MAVQLILVKTDGTGAPAQCEDRHGPTYWTAGGGITWNGSAWVLPTSANSTLTVSGTWANGYRPASVDITYTMTAGYYLDDHTFYIIGGGLIGNSGSISNGTGTHVVNVPLTFASNDIASLSITSFGYYGTTTIDALCFNA